MVDTSSDDTEGGPREDVGVVTLAWLVSLQHSLELLSPAWPGLAWSPLTFPKPWNVGKGEPEAKTARPSE